MKRAHATIRRSLRRFGFGELAKSADAASLALAAVLVLLAGVVGWPWNLGLWGDRPIEAVAANEESDADRDAPLLTANQPAQIRLRDEEVARLKAEIAALDAEANQAQRFVELYQAAESRRDRLAAAEAASTEPLLSPQVLADLEIDRAAAITVLSADAQARHDNRPDEATEAYQSVSEHFPDSRWASVARERLVQLRSMN